MVPGQPSRDHAALAAVYRSHHAFVWRSVRRLGVDEAAVDDAVHEVFMIVARRLAEFEGRAQMRTWLFAIAMRVVQNHARAQWRHRRRAEALAAEPRDDGIDVIARSDAAATLHRLLAELSEDQRAAFILAELEGLSAPEIATALEVNVNTIYARIRAARQRMQDIVTRVEQQAVAPTGEGSGA